ncbi:type II secretion system F family protein [Nocardioides ungokensis]|uniref:type II secretion system F family protein n=1 Tax=Nocardioides ungokensis TaxID=1643322 RepID=UPI0015DFADD1|nr:type II secretion system F family protein [Nocardioides ungokensis]
MTSWVPVACAASAAALAVPRRPRLPPAAAPGPQQRATGWMRRHRPLWALLAGLGALLFVGGPAGPVAGVGAAAGVWVVIGRAETPEDRRAREEVRRDLPHLVTLFAAALRSGVAPGDGIALVCAALPGAASARLAGVVARLALGVDPVQVWEALGDDPELAPLGRALARSQATGAAVVPTMVRLTEDLARRARADVEDRARAVGVKAALPLGLCLLPAFVLVGIVPLVAGLLTGLAL